MLPSKPQELSLATGLFLSTLSANFVPNSKSDHISFMLSSLSSLNFLRSVSVSFSHTPNCLHQYGCFFRSSNVSPISSPKLHKFLPSSKRYVGTNASVEQLVGLKTTSEKDYDGAFNSDPDVQGFDFGKIYASLDMKHLSVPDLEVKELEELPEQWRRARLAWLCKHLPAHKSGTLTRMLNEQKKWMTQEDATYVAVHCMRIRDNDTAFKVYKWMIQQKWYRFDFALATKLADCLGKERKFAKCREIFDDIINKGLVPSESTFHILIVSYLSSSIQGCLEEACSIYNRMIQLGGYQPRLSLHNSLFRSLVSKPGISSKHYLNQAEFVFHNLVTSGLEIHKDVYGGLIWLHSYQDTVDKKRITSLRKEMQQAGIEESREVLLSILRACSKEGDVEEAERTWLKLLHSDGGLPSLAFVYKMEIYSKVEEPKKALDIFREMQDQLGTANLVAYNKIIEILCQSEEVQLAESIMTDLINSGLKPLATAYIHLMNMYFNLSLHDKLEMKFSEGLEKCQPNQSIYGIYLDSLVKVGNLQKAEEVFNQMHNDASIGIDGRSCNIILSCYLSSGDYVKAEKIYDMMCMKRYDIETPLMEKLEYILSCRKTVRRPVSLKLSKEQREVLVGLLIGGLHIESDDQRKTHVIHFNFNESSDIHSVFRSHIHEQFHEWLHPSFRHSGGIKDVPYKFYTIAQSQFGFYADQFWPKGSPAMPSLIHRWLSPCVLAYWYMYGGRRSSAGDVLLKLKVPPEGVEKIVKSLKEKSIECKVRRKGKVFWIGILGENAVWFWKLVEPHVIEKLKAFLRPSDSTLKNNLMENQDINSGSGSDSDEKAGYQTDDDRR